MLTKAIKHFFSSGKPSRTFLYDFHISLNAKMVEFAGYEMPVNYKEGILKEHLFCREKSGLFDVSHMGQVKIRGKNAQEFVEKICVADVKGLNLNGSTLSLILNETAGIIDDTIVTKFADHMHMVVNAGNKFKDLEHMNKVKDEFFKGKDVSIQYIEDRSLVALQGPAAKDVLQKILKDQLDLTKVNFMTHLDFSSSKIADFSLMISRSGYTGEDGFEISIPNSETTKFVQLLLEDQRVAPIGLGARDSLRLEAGLCLHGHDINETINPVEAALMWTVRKSDFGFIGGQELEKIKKKGAEKKRIGFLVKAGAGTAREGSELKNANGANVGIITSGTYSPCLKIGCGMAYVHKDHAKIGTPLKAVVKGRELEVKIAKMPFVPSRYYKI